MNKNIIIGLVVVVVVLGGIYFFAIKQNAPAQPVTQQTQNATEPGTVTIKDFAFSPVTLTVKTGTKVTWVNNDSVTHSVKSDTFNSQDLSPGSTFEFTFSKAGTYTYSCGIHPSMKGTVIVE